MNTTEQSTSSGRAAPPGAAPDPTAIRLALLNEGYMPVPVCPPDCTHVGKKGLCTSGGKAVHLAGWNKGGFKATDIRGWQRSRPKDTNTGLQCGEFVGVDGDILDAEMAAKTEEAAEQHLGPTPLRRIGRAPKWLRGYRTETPWPKMVTPARTLDGVPIQVEILGKGQQVVAYGTHPVTMQPYTWTDGEPINTPLADLPVVSETQIRAFLVAVNALFDAAGAIPSKPDDPAQDGPKANGHDAKAEAQPNGAGAGQGNEFFRNVNKAALGNIKTWFTALFPKARQEPGTGAWRVSSDHLGRPLEEDLSMHPTHGGRDFGTGKSVSPIDVVTAWGDKTDAKDAAFWLCDQLGKKPADLGWEETARAKQKAPGTNEFKPHPILTAAQFMATFTCPDYIVDGIIQRGRLHFLTSKTGHGKTAVGLYLAASIDAGRNIDKIEVTQGDVVLLAGENPDDLCGRFYATCQHHRIEVLNMPHVLPGNFPMTPEAAEELKIRIDALGLKPAMILADSAAAYFPGDNENDNVQMGAYARTWRILNTCKGNQAVVVLCHPVKNAPKDNLLPKGGGSFLNEGDRGLTLWAEDHRETTTLHWQGKIRGADFQPVHFALKPVKLDGIVDAKGRPFLSVVAELQTDEQAEKAIKQTMTDENTVLEWLRREPGISIANIARNAGWLSEQGVPKKSKIHRLLTSLAKLKLVKSCRGGKWEITDAGKDELARKTG